MTTFSTADAVSVILHLHFLDYHIEFIVSYIAVQLPIFPLDSQPNDTGSTDLQYPISVIYVPQESKLYLCAFLVFVASTVS